jgi:hypothetical protein
MVYQTDRRKRPFPSGERQQQAQQQMVCVIFMGLIYDTKESFVKINYRS